LRVCGVTCAQKYCARILQRTPKSDGHLIARHHVNAREARNLRTRARKMAPTKLRASAQHKKFVDASIQLHYPTHTVRVMFQLTDSKQNFVTRDCGQKGGIINGD
jgi:hypothetical protein